MTSQGPADDQGFVEDALRDYHERGARGVGILVHEEACPTCLVHRGRVYAFDDVPPLPVAGCERSECRCDYQPAM
jgi:hypothetical protein